MLSIGISGLALLSGSLVIFAMTWNETHFIRRFLRHPSLLFFGRYSYGLYVFHWPVTSMMIMVFSKSNPDSINWLLFSLACFIITIILALISWNLIEQPILICLLRSEQRGAPVTEQLHLISQIFADISYVALEQAPEIPIALALLVRRRLKHLQAIRIRIVGMLTVITILV